MKLLNILFYLLFFYSCSNAQKWYDIKDCNNHSFVGNWEQLTITDNGDTVIYHACFDVAHKINVDTIKKELFVQYDMEDVHYPIDTVHLEKDEFIISFVNNICTPFRCKIIDQNKALWTYKYMEDGEVYHNYFTNEKRYFKEIKEKYDDQEPEDSPTPIVAVQNHKWFGEYEYFISDTTVVPSPFIEYTLSIAADQCVFSGNGHMTAFEIQCSVKTETKDKLSLDFVKSLSEDTLMPNIDRNVSPTVNLYYRKGKYYLESPFISNTDGKKNVKIECRKIK